MLLHEIKRTPTPTLPSNNRTLHPGDQPKRFTKVGSGIGSGLYDSEVYVDKQHPNQILKIVPIRDKSDSYLRFIQMIKSHQNNPFFPKIHGIRIYDVDQFDGKTDDGYEYSVDSHLMLYVWMEKLHPLTVLEDDHIRQLLSIVGIDYEGKMQNDMSLRNTFRYGENRRDLQQKTIIPKFKEALRILEPMFRKFGQDVHIENIMVRLTGVGPQLVIVDPLYPSFPAEELDYIGFDDWNY